MSIVESLPENPLTERDITELDTSPATDFCESIVGRRLDDEPTPPTDAVVAFWLATESNTYLLGYDPTDEQWTLVDEFAWDDIELEEYLDESTNILLDWLDSYYDPDTLAFITDTESDDEVEAHLLDILPSTVVTPDEILDLTQIPGIEHTTPLATLADSDDVLLFSAALFDTVYVLGFEASMPEHLVDPERASTGDWLTYSTHAIDEDTDPAEADPDVTESFERLEEYYSADDVERIDS